MVDLKGRITERLKFIYPQTNKQNKQALVQLLSLTQTNSVFSVYESTLLKSKHKLPYCDDIAHRAGGIPHPCHVTQNEKCRYKSHFRHTVHPPKSWMSTQREGNYFYIVFLLAILSRRVYWINSGNTWFFRLHHFVMRLTRDYGGVTGRGGGTKSRFVPKVRRQHNRLQCLQNRPRSFPPVHRTRNKFIL